MVNNRILIIGIVIAVVFASAIVIGLQDPSDNNRDTSQSSTQTNSSTTTTTINSTSTTTTIKEPTVNCRGSAKCFNGEVTKIRDGDTIEVDGQPIRLSLVNAIERKDETISNNVTAFTEQLCPVGSIVLVDQDDLQPFDTYNRMMAVVYCGDKNLNAELIYSKNAVIISRYCEVSEFSNEDWAKIDGC